MSDYILEKIVELIESDQKILDLMKQMDASVNAHIVSVDNHASTEINRIKDLLNDIEGRLTTLEDGNKNTITPTKKVGE
tara:strand:+ start:2074 stop:2310 length:237 start_codon:yes stop_codon:yes gene_type:complete